VTELTDTSLSFISNSVFVSLSKIRVPGAHVIHKLCSTLLLVALLQSSVFGQDQLQSAVQSVASMQSVLHQAQAKHKLVKVTLLNQRGNRKKINGTVYEISDAGFTLLESRSGASMNFDYKDVRQVQQKGLPTATVIVLGVGVAVGVLVAIFYALYPKT
jgi:hypothetical protein